MRRITYAGDTVLTTDPIAEVLVELTAALARNGQAEAVKIPTAIADSTETSEAELVIGVGNDVLSVPVAWSGDEPDFDAFAADLRAHPILPQPVDQKDDDQPGDEPVDFDLFIDRG